MEDKTTEELRNNFETAAQELTRRTLVDPQMHQIPFPRGYIRRIEDLRPRWPYLTSDHQRNMACVCQLCDINRWHLNTWKISLTAGTMWEWQAALPVIAMMEHLIHGFGIRTGIFSENTNFKRAINKLHNAQVYKNQMRGELHSHREFRNEVHLYLKGRVEMHDDKPKRYNKAVRTLRKLEGILLEQWNKRSL